MNIKVDAKALDLYKGKLKSLNKSAFPTAVRNTLNDAAFDMKKNELHKSAKKNFKHTRSNNFFKRFTRVERANGFKIDQMQAVMGMVDLGDKAARTAVENMGLHEKGGMINDGAMYLKESRTANAFGKLVRKVNYYDKNKVISGRSKQKRGRGTKKSKFVARAYRALKEKKPMFFDSMKGNFLVEVKSIKKSKKGKLRIKTKLLMKERKYVNIKRNSFVSEGAYSTKHKIPEFYKKQAYKQIKKYTK